MFLLSVKQIPGSLSSWPDKSKTKQIFSCFLPFSHSHSFVLWKITRYSVSNAIDKCQRKPNTVTRFLLVRRNTFLVYCITAPELCLHLSFTPGSISLVWDLCWLFSSGTFQLPHYSKKGGRPMAAKFTWIYRQYEAIILRGIIFTHI